MRITMIGLGAMGLALAQNIRDHGHDVEGIDASPAAREKAASEGLVVHDDITALAGMEQPRVAWVMVPAAHVDEVLDDLLEVLEEGDIIIEGGNSHPSDTARRLERCEQAGIWMLGMGVSGGQDGARHGPSLMPSGSRQAWDHVRRVLEDIAARHDGEACVAWLGPREEGHLIKITHNGIEYALMQAIGEVASLMLASGKSHEEAAEAFEELADDEWCGGYLTSITAGILRATEDGTPVLTRIADTASQKGTGKWTSQRAYDVGVPVHGISAALLARFMSAAGDLRMREIDPGAVALDQDMIRGALRACYVAAFTQGMHLLLAEKHENGYHFTLSEVARIWRAGCIIRTPMLERIRAAMAADETLLVSSDAFLEELKKGRQPLARLIEQAVQARIPVPEMMMTLAWTDAMLARRVESAAVIAAQRDYFGHHGFRRVDDESIYHHDWQ